MCNLAALLVAACVVALASEATAAPKVQLAIHDGRVSLVATDATIRQILAEWASVGLTRIINGERVGGGPVTIQLSDIPEQDALDLLLRSTAGYIAAPRDGAFVNGSRFDRIVIMPTSASPPASASRAVASPAPVTIPPAAYPQPPPFQIGPGVQRVIGADGLPVPDDQDDGTGPPPSRQVTGTPPGIAPAGDPPPAPAGVTPAMPAAAPSAAPTAPAGVTVPGTIVPLPAPGDQQRPPRL